ncbi:MAG: TerB family tellurite resistance protein [Alphaproteobacteria bacterium]|nr:TerB family tellurite resistance protein [Alphaproteobacteria bacterium]
MWGKVKSFLFEREGRAENESGHSSEELHIAACALLAEAALIDGSYDEEEAARIVDLAQRHLGLDAESAHNLLEEALKRARQAVDVHAFISPLMKNFDHQQRVILVEMLWDVVYADGELHDYEANLMRRVAGLLHISDQESGAARKRVLERTE